MYVYCYVSDVERRDGRLGVRRKCSVVQCGTSPYLYLREERTRERKGAAARPRTMIALRRTTAGDARDRSSLIGMKVMFMIACSAAAGYARLFGMECITYINVASRGATWLSQDASRHTEKWTGGPLAGPSTTGTARAL